MKVDAKEFAEDCYTSYAKFVNAYRALPNSLDGLKLVQRRVLSTLFRTGGHGDLIATSSVVGDCNKYYHPHGEISVVGAAYNMVNDEVKLISGKGNFGYRGLISAPAAAQRYTKLCLTERSIKYISPLFKHVDHFINENEYEEPIALPLGIPYSMLSGCIGIGIGCITNIPPFSEKDIITACKCLLEGKPVPYIRPVSLGGGIVNIDDENLKSINETGEGSFTVKCKLTRVHDSNMNHEVFEISNVPDVVNLTKIYIIFKDEIAEKLIFVRDESQKTIRIIVGRTKRIRRVTDQYIEEKLNKICARRVSAKCYNAHNGVARVLTPRQMLETALEYAVKCNERMVRDLIYKTEEKILFETVKHQLAKLIIENKTEDDIIKILKLTKDQFTTFTQKSLSTLRAIPKDLDKLGSDLTNMRCEASNNKLSYGNRFGFLTK